jgi:prepilin-type N-terminal cleavage/methylation domain-containing protein
MKMKRRAFTLMEIMIVILLIGIIGGVISFNMRGSLEKGRAFKTEQQISQITDILEMELAKGEYPREQIIKEAEGFIKRAGWVKNPEKFMKDGWDRKILVLEDKGRPDRIIVRSEGLEAYKEKQRKAVGKATPVSSAAGDEEDDTQLPVQ